MKKPLTKEQSAKAAAEFGAFMRAECKELRDFTDGQIRQAFPEIWTGWAMRLAYEAALLQRPSLAKGAMPENERSDRCEAREAVSASNGSNELKKDSP